MNKFTFRATTASVPARAIVERDLRIFGFSPTDIRKLDLDDIEVRKALHPLIDRVKQAEGAITNEFGRTQVPTRYGTPSTAQPTGLQGTLLRAGIRVEVKTLKKDGILDMANRLHSRANQAAGTLTTLRSEAAAERQAPLGETSHTGSVSGGQTTSSTTPPSQGSRSGGNHTSRDTTSHSSERRSDGGRVSSTGRTTTTRSAPSATTNRAGTGLPSKAAPTTPRSNTDVTGQRTSVERRPTASTAAAATAGNTGAEGSQLVTTVAMFEIDTTGMDDTVKGQINSRYSHELEKEIRRAKRTLPLENVPAQQWVRVEQVNGKDRLTIEFEGFKKEPIRKILDAVAPKLQTNDKTYPGLVVSPYYGLVEKNERYHEGQWRPELPDSLAEAKAAYERNPTPPGGIRPAGPSDGAQLGA